MVNRKSDDDAIAAFIRARGVTRVAEGSATLGHMSARDWRNAARDTVSIQARTEQRAIDERHYVVGADGIEHCRNGLGEWIY